MDTVPLTTDDDVSLATVLTALVDEVEAVGTLADLQNNRAPTRGRVAEVTSTDTYYIGDGDAWQPAEAFASLLTNRSWRRLAALTADGTLSDQGVIQPVDTSGNTVTVTLASAMAEDGAEVVIKDEGGNAGTNAVTIDTEGGETIDGSASITIASNYGVQRLYSDGTNWFKR
jgi:hypothetical protein